MSAQTTASSLLSQFRVHPIMWSLGLLLLLSPIVMRDNGILNILTVAMIWTFWASSLNVIWGFAGQFSMAQVALGGLSAYIFVILSGALKLGLPIAILAGILASVVASVVIGYMSLKLSGFRFSIMTLAFALAGIGLASTLEITGRTSGISVPGDWPKIDLGFGTWSLSGLDGGFAFFMMLVFLAMMVGLHALLRARPGRGLLAIREDPLLVESLGTSAARYRLFAFALSAVVAGVAGVFQAQYYKFIFPNLFSFGTLIIVIVVLTLGGRGSIIGPLVGGLLYAILSTGFKVGGEFQGAVFGGAIIVLTIFARRGLSHYLFLGEEWVLRVVFRRKSAPAASIGEPLAVQQDSVSEVAGLLERNGERSEVLLRVTGLHKQFGGVAAVHDVSFDVHEGEIFGLIGPNGAGKTTMFNLVSGFLRSDGGAVLWRGNDVSKLPAFERARLGMVRTFQQPRVFAELSVRENLVIASESRRVDRDLATRVEAVQRALTNFDLFAAADSPASDLSYGHAKRLGVALAVVTGAELIMLDEPAAGLNSREIGFLREDILRLRNAGCTVLLVEHHMELVMNLCDQVLVLDAGKVIASGSPDEVVANPMVIDAYLGGLNETA